MSNISWSKTVGNWGVNKEITDETDKLIRTPIKKQELDKSELVEKLNMIRNNYLELLKTSNELYQNFSNKDLSDSIISLESALDALENITVK